MGLGQRGTPWDEVVVGRGDHIAEYLAQHPEIPKPSYGHFHGYPTRRGVAEEDLALPEIENHPMVQFLRSIGVPDSELGEIVTYPHPGCEDIGFTLRFLPREIWLSMLVLEPLGPPVVFESVKGDLRSEGESEVDRDVEVTFPPVPITATEAILLPLGVMLPPFGMKVNEKEQLWGDIVEPGLFQSLDRVEFSAELSQLRVIEAILEPSEIRFRIGKRRRSLQPHRFDPANTLALDTMWITGTCPHLFERGLDGRLVHIRELLPAGHGRLDEDFHVPSQGCRELVIAELEFEVTNLVSIEQSGRRLASDVTLRRGDTLAVGVDDEEPIRFVGSYDDEVIPTKPGGSRFKIAVLTEYLAKDTAERAP